MEGSVEIILRDREGNIVEHRKVKNLIVSSGKTLIANLFRGIEKKGVSHVAVGTGDKVPLPTDIELENELSPRKQFEKNEFIEEKSASITLYGAQDIPMCEITAKEPGKRGNNIQMKVEVFNEKITLYVMDTARGESTLESHECTLLPQNENYIGKVDSNLINVKVLEHIIPVGTVTEDWVPLVGGSDAEVTLSATFDYHECNGELREAGIFNSAEKGAMYNRVVFPVINKSKNLTLTLVWRITF